MPLALRALPSRNTKYHNFPSLQFYSSLKCIITFIFNNSFGIFLKNHLICIPKEIFYRMQIILFYFILLILFIFQGLFAQYYHFEGILEPNLKISMDLYKNDKTLKGVYFYYSSGQPLNLTGKVDNDLWKLEETDLNNNKTGTWEVKLNGNQLIGNWSGNGKKLTVNLKEDYSTGLKFKIIEILDEYKASENYGLKNYLGLYFPLPPLNPQKSPTALKSICDTILAEVNMKSKDLNENMIKKEFQKSFDEIRETYIGFVNNEKEACENAPFTCDWSNSQEGYPVFNQNNILSYRNSMSSYMGGAHGSYGTWHCNFNTANGQMIFIENLFKEDSEKPLINILKSKLKQKYKTNNLEAVNLDEVFVSENFQITYSGIVFHYNPYEIGPYSLGAPEVFVPYSELKPFLVNGHPLNWVK